MGRIGQCSLLLKWQWGRRCLINAGTKMKVPRIKSAPFADQSPVRTDCRLMDHIDQYGSTPLIARLKFTILISILERSKTVTY